MRSILKNKQVKKRANLRTKLLAIGASTLFLIGGVATKLQTFSPGIVNDSASKSIASQLNADTTYMNLQSTNMRFIAPKNAPIMVNVNIDNLSDEQMATIYESVSGLSNIINQINPKYELQVRFNPTKSQLNSIYCININKEQCLPEKIGHCKMSVMLPTTSGLGIYKTQIGLETLLFENSTTPRLNMLKNVLDHELCHAIAGLEDAYNIEDYNKHTVMHGSTESPITYSYNDILLLQSKLAPNKIAPNNSQEIFTNSIPSSVAEKIKKIKSITPEQLNSYFFSSNKDKQINAPIEYTINQTIYASNNSRYFFNSANNSNTKCYINNDTLNICSIDVSNGLFEKFQSDHSILKGEYNSQESIISTYDNITYLRTGHFVLKWGDKIVLIDIVRDSMELLDIIPQASYEKIKTNIQKYDSADKYYKRISQLLTQEYPESITIDELQKTQFTDSNNTYNFYQDYVEFKTIDTGGIMNLKTLNFDNAIFLSNNIAVIKTHGQILMVNYHYDIENNSLNILSKWPIHAMEHNLIK